MTTKSDLPPAASDEPEYEIDSFELLWEKYKARIIAIAVAVVVVIVAVFGWFITTNMRRSAAESAFARAKAPADYRAVIDDYSSSPAAGDAALLLADSLRDEKKYDEANQVLERFTRDQPEHSLAPLAKVAIAGNLALAGKTEDAAKALEAIGQANGNSFVAPYALWLAAELKSAQGDRTGAVRAYRELERAFPTSVSAQVSAQSAEALKSLVEPEAPAAAESAASATPAP